MKLPTTLLLPVVSLNLALAQAPALWTPEFAMRVQTIGAVVPSPDGKMAAWVQTRAVVDRDHSEMTPQIWIAHADGSHRFQLTRGEKGATAPSFSPDGRYVYFTSDRSGKDNVYRILVAGGEAEMITEFKGSLGEYQLSPDGKSVAFTGYEPPADLEKAKKEKRDFRVVDSNPANMGLYVVPAEPASDGKRPQRKLFDNQYHVADFDWSPDSNSIAFTHQPRPEADYWTKADISEVDVASGAVKTLAATGAAESSPIYSPDGRYVAFTRTSDPPRWAGEARIAVLPRGGGEPRVLPATSDEQPNLVGWTADSKQIIFGELKRTRSAVYAMPMEGTAREIYDPAQGVVGFAALRMNRTGTEVGFSYETADRAPEAYVLALSGGGPVQVSQANTGLPKLPLGKTETITWKSKDGRQIEGLLTLPVDYENGKRYPLILNIHGGPTGVFEETFIGRFGLYPIATFAARGYAVLRPNPRGSSGYGKEFRFANYNDWGGMDYQDDQAGVDKVIAMGIADPDRLAVMGWSYGGFMTSWTITQTHRFKAAAIGAGVTDLWSFTGTADIPGFLPDYFGGEPWNNFENYRKHSPITYVKGVTTPTLILHGEADIRVPPGQDFEFYHSLKSQGVITKMVTYPRQPHGPREPKFVLDIMNRHLDWVDKYVR